MFWDDIRDWLAIGWERVNTLRPPPAVEVSWKSTWPVPLYGLACIAHWRFRVWKPRRLPTLTTVTVWEVYGTLALGHVAHMEANRLARRVAEDDSLRLIDDVARWAQSEYRVHPQRFAPTHDKTQDLTLGLFRRPVDGFQVWKYNLRCSWADEQKRVTASSFLTPWLTVDGLANRDAALVTLFVSERLEGSTILHPSFLHDRHLMGKVAFFTISSMFLRWADSNPEALRTSVLMQRYLFYVVAFKWLGGRYCPYASIFGLDNPFLAALGAGMSRLDWKIKNFGLDVQPWLGEVADVPDWT